MKTRFLTISLATALFAAIGVAGEHPSAEHPKAGKPGHTTVMGLLFHADWCASCKALEPKLKAVKPEFKEQIEFVKLDLTDDDTRSKAAAKADKLGVSEVFAEHGGKTGFMLLVDRKSHAVLGKITKDMNVDAVRGAMNAALAGAGSEHPKAEHPRSEHPKAEHPKREHPSK